jgi:ERF superfamily
MNAVTKMEDHAAPAVQSDASAIVSMIERAALNPNVDIDKMERLLQMQERILEKASKSAYATAFALMQGELPSIDRKGRITITDKNDRDKIIQSTPYSKWEDINDAIKPILRLHGFGLSFRVGQAADGRITVTCVLSHREGHSEETTMVLMLDTTGSKNNVQAMGSSISYGKRYTASAMLNITSHGEDDDGKAADAPEAITDDQAIILRELAESVGADMPKFLAYVKVGSLTEIRADKFKDAVSILEAKRGRS